MASPIKERLTGALILVAAIVIVVPEMFSGGHHGREQEGDLFDEASSAPAGRTYEMAVDPAAAADVAQETLAPRAAGAAEEDGSIDPVAVPPPVVASEPLPVETPEQVEPPVAALPAAASTAPAPARAEPAPSGRWWVQLGRFSARDNAEQLASRLRDRGFKIAVSQVRADGKEWHLVRAGPAADRAAADALQKRLAQAGQRDSFLVAP